MEGEGASLPGESSLLSLSPVTIVHLNACKVFTRFSVCFALFETEFSYVAQACSFLGWYYRPVPYSQVPA